MIIVILFIVLRELLNKDKVTIKVTGSKPRYDPGFQEFFMKETFGARTGEEKAPVFLTIDDFMNTPSPKRASDFTPVEWRMAHMVIREIEESSVDLNNMQYWCFVEQEVIERLKTASPELDVATYIRTALEKAQEIPRPYLKVHKGVSRHKDDSFESGFVIEGFGHIEYGQVELNKGMSLFPFDKIGRLTVYRLEEICDSDNFLKSPVKAGKE
jgi:hypothetical protein